MKQEVKTEQNNYGRLAFDMVNEVKNKLKNEKQKEIFTLKELYFKGKFVNNSWQTTFEGLEGSFAKITFVSSDINAQVLFNVNGVNIYKSDGGGTININLPLVAVNTITITCNNSEQPFALYIFGNLIENKKNHQLFLLENGSDLDAIYYKNGYHHSSITSIQEILDEELPSTPLHSDLLSVCYRLRNASTVIIQDFGVLFKEDGYLKLTLKSTGFQQSQVLGDENMADKAAVVPVVHTRYSYHIPYYKNGAITSLYVDANLNVLRTIQHSIEVPYPVILMGGCVYKSGSVYQINCFWYIDSNNDAYLVAARNFNRSSTVFSYHSNTFSFGKAEKIKIYNNGLTLTCYKQYKNTVTILTFQVTLANPLNFLQLVKKETYNSAEDAFYLFDKHILKYRELFTEITLE